MFVKIKGKKKSEFCFNMDHVVTFEKSVDSDGREISTVYFDNIPEPLHYGGFEIYDALVQKIEEHNQF